MIGLRNTNFIGHAYGRADQVISSTGIADTIIIFVTTWLMFLVIIVVWRQKSRTGHGFSRVLWIDRAVVCIGIDDGSVSGRQDRTKRVAHIQVYRKVRGQGSAARKLEFENDLVSGILAFVEMEDDDGEVSSDYESSESGIRCLEHTSDHNVQHSDTHLKRPPAHEFWLSRQLKTEFLEILTAKECGVVYILGHSHAKAKKSSSIMNKLAIGVLCFLLPQQTLQGTCCSSECTSLFIA
ncbi:hypothetical protein GW17_00059010 [Ensete ventricosum]|nr:hypothetical protein GW17_00059010 [Ensete ventricosum]